MVPWLVETTISLEKAAWRVGKDRLMLFLDGQPNTLIHILAISDSGTYFLTHLRALTDGSHAFQAHDNALAR